MLAETLLFWFLALATVLGATGLLLLSNPIYAAFSLIFTMVGISGLFASLGANFLAGVQIIVYAGAVLVLFVMVLMLFDLKKEQNPFSSGAGPLTLKVALMGMGVGVFWGVARIESGLSETVASAELERVPSVKELGQLIFSKYVLLFQALGVLLLVVAIGAVALARSRGGTHERN